ncbi:MAG: hypothetical protein WC071_12835 [Victivallaceae bacterium]
MLYGAKVIDEVDNLYRVIKLIRFRKTDKVTFDMVSTDLIGNVNAIDKVIHRQGAYSPGSAEGVTRPWYMHPFQEDNLLVVHGSRDIEIYTPKYNRVEHFTVYPEQIFKNGELLAEGTCIINWPCGVFHRIISNDSEGSVSLNFAVYHAGFDINSNFNVYDLNADNGQYRLIREGSKDQDIQEGF